MRVFPGEKPLVKHLLEPATDAAGRTTSAYVNLENAVAATIICYVDQGNAATISLTPVQSTLVDGTGTKAISAVARIWANEDCAANADATAQTAAVAFTTSAAVKIKTVEFEIDPTAQMDVAGGFKCIGLTTGASNVANITSAVIHIWPKHAGATAPSFIAD